MRFKSVKAIGETGAAGVDVSVLVEELHQSLEDNADLDGAMIMELDLGAGFHIEYAHHDVVVAGERTSFMAREGGDRLYLFKIVVFFHVCSLAFQAPISARRAAMISSAPFHAVSKLLRNRTTGPKSSYSSAVMALTK